MNPISTADCRDRSSLSRRAGAPAAAVLGAWFLFALGASLVGIFDSRRGVPLALGLSAVLPVVVFVICWTRLEVFRAFTHSLSPRALLWAQTWRVGGILFLILHSRAQLPASFALPAGWGDIAVGVTAPLVALAMDRLPRKLFIAWNLVGIADLALAITLGVLSSAGPLGILAHGVTTRPMSLFPLSLIPTFAVPLLAIFHLIVLGQPRSVQARA